MNITETSATSPPGGEYSYHMVQRRGFFRDGLMLTMRKGMEKIPWNGAEHALQRPLLGKIR